MPIVMVRELDRGAVTVVALLALAVAGCAPPTESEDDDRLADHASAFEKGAVVEQILAKLETCRRVSSAPFAKDAGGAARLDVCGLRNAVFWKADMDIDCDGKPSAVCNRNTDPSYQAQTAATDSTGKPLDAAKLPFIVVPGVSSRWSYKDAGIAMGSVGLVIYDGKVEYGIVGDVGPKAILGEASYAMAKNLGINPNPSTGGVADGVTYVIFTGPTGRVTKKEDHAEAVTLAKRRAAQLLDEN